MAVPVTIRGRENIRSAGTLPGNGAGRRAASNPDPAGAGISSPAFSSTTASLPSHVAVSTPIMARPEAENAGTWEYRHEASRRSSTSVASSTTSDSSQRSNSLSVTCHHDCGGLTHATLARARPCGIMKKPLGVFPSPRTSKLPWTKTGSFFSTTASRNMISSATWRQPSQPAENTPIFISSTSRLPR